VFTVIGRMTVRPRVIISLLAGEERRHDQLARSPGAFRQALTTVLLLRELGCRVALSISLTRETIDQLGKAADLADQLGCALSIISEVYSSVGGVIDTLPLTVTPEELLRARRSILGDRKVELSQKTCSQGVLAVTIDHEGFVVGCERNTTRRFGSLLHETLQEIVARPDYARYMRDFYRRPAACAGCPEELSRYCNWCPAIPFNFDIGPEHWLDFHCTMAMRRRLFWTGRGDPVPGARSVTRQALAGRGVPAEVTRGKKIALPLVSEYRAEKE
jgi:hypothetical protein